MRGRHRRVVLVLVSAALSCAWTPVAGAAAASAATARAGESVQSPGWHVQKEFGCGGLDSLAMLLAVTATGPANAWATGQCGQAPAPLIAHWDGTSWRVLRPPAVSGALEAEPAVASLSSSYTWIFASAVYFDPEDFALLRHGNRWTTFQLANDSTINSAVVFGRSNAWGFGTVGHGAYAVRFNGRYWRRVPIPVVPLATAAPKPDDIWAVGPPVRAAGAEFPQTYSLAHWTGKVWKVQPFPSLNLPSGAYLDGASVISGGPGAAFVTVTFGSRVSVDPFPVLLQWNGSSWANVKLPFEPAVLGPMAHDGHGGLWVASIPASGDPNFDDVMLDRSAAGTWSQKLVPVDGLGVNAMRLIPGTTSVWAVGYIASDCNPDSCVVPVIVRGP